MIYTLKNDKLTVDEETFWSRTVHKWKRFIVSFSEEGITEVGTYEVEVIANSIYAIHSSSDKSNSVSYVKSANMLNSPIITLNENIVSWEAIENAESYEVFVNGESRGTQSELSYTIADTEVGSYEVEVIAKTSSEQFIASGKSNKIVYVIL